MKESAKLTDSIARLRELTGAGILDCKSALHEAKGDLKKAQEILRNKGKDIAKKKFGREAREGQIISYVHMGGKIAAVVEVNCETDFVARNEVFQRFGKDVAMQVAAQTEDKPILDQQFIKDPTKSVRDYLTETVARLGENVRIRRIARFEVGVEPHVEEVTE